MLVFRVKIVAVALEVTIDAIVTVSHSADEDLGWLKLGVNVSLERTLACTGRHFFSAPSLYTVDVGVVDAWIHT